MNSHTKQSAQILANDREWFCRHPEEAIRFRPIQTGEFELLKINGIEPPKFRPSWCKHDADLKHVSVIDLTRLLQSEETSMKTNETIRIRIVTIRARSKSVQQKLQGELIEAICKELLLLHGSPKNHSPIESGFEWLITAA